MSWGFCFDNRSVRAFRQSREGWMFESSHPDLEASALFAGAFVAEMNGRRDG